MAKSKRRKSQKRRDNVNIANQRLPFLKNKFFKLGTLTKTQDRRVFTPEGRDTNAKNVHGRKHGLTTHRSVVIRRLRDGKLSRNTTERIAFKDRKRVLVCVRRRVRREVLHASRKTGQRGQKRPRWNGWSRIKCR